MHISPHIAQQNSNACAVVDIPDTLDSPTQNPDEDYTMTDRILYEILGSGSDIRWDAMTLPNTTDTGNSDFLDSAHCRHTSKDTALSLFPNSMTLNL